MQNLSVCRALSLPPCCPFTPSAFPHILSLPLPPLPPPSPSLAVPLLSSTSWQRQQKKLQHLVKARMQLHRQPTLAKLPGNLGVGAAPTVPSHGDSVYVTSICSVLHTSSNTSGNISSSTQLPLELFRLLSFPFASLLFLPVRCPNPLSYASPDVCRWLHTMG